MKIPCRRCFSSFEPTLCSTKEFPTIVDSLGSADWFDTELSQRQLSTLLFHII